MKTEASTVASLFPSSSLLAAVKRSVNAEGRGWRARNARVAEMKLRPIIIAMLGLATRSILLRADDTLENMVNDT